MKNMHVKILQAITKNLMPEVEDVLEFISSNPEVSWNEYKAVDRLCECLEGHNFSIVKEFENCPTGFLAEFKNGDGPKIVYLAKYNALPNFDENGEDAHGCGHNWVAALAVGSAIALKNMQDFHGTVAVVGAPEGSFFKPKVSILYSDYFKDTDAVFAAHLNDVDLLYSFPLPINAYSIKIIGERSQAFSYPDKGINAVNCMMDALYKVRELRSGLKEFDRINYTVVDGSKPVDFVPAYVELRVAVGGTTSARRDAISEDVLNVFYEVCEEYGAKLEVELANKFEDIVNLDSLHDLIEECFKDVNQEYRVMPEVLGRTQLDISTVSHICPMQYMFFGVPNWISHQPTVARIEASHSAEAKQKLETAINIYANAGYKIIIDDELRDKIHNEFEIKISKE